MFLFLHTQSLAPEVSTTHCFGEATFCRPYSQARAQTIHVPRPLLQSALLQSSDPVLERPRPVFLPRQSVAAGWFVNRLELDHDYVELQGKFIRNAGLRVTNVTVVTSVKVFVVGRPPRLVRASLPPFTLQVNHKSFKMVRRPLDPLFEPVYTPSSQWPWCWTLDWEQPQRSLPTLSPALSSSLPLSSSSTKTLTSSSTTGTRT